MPIIRSIVKTIKYLYIYIFIYIVRHIQTWFWQFRINYRGRGVEKSSTPTLHRRIGGYMGVYRKIRLGFLNCFLPRLPFFAMIGALILFFYLGVIVPLRL